MFTWIKSLWNDWCVKGVHWPFAHDPVTGKPSITLMYSYVTFMIACASIGAAHYNVRYIPATIISIFFWVIAVVFYMIRKLNKAKIDLQNKSLELDNDDDKKPSAPARDEAT